MTEDYPWKNFLPKSLMVGGKEYEIRSDYRAVLDICAALSDPDLDGYDRADALLKILYIDHEEITPGLYDDAINQGLWFINGGDDGNNKPSPRLVDWEQDFKYIVAPINRVCGHEIRDIEYMHWWTFLSAYMEIGDCTFAQIVKIRSQLAKGKTLDKSDRAWYREHKEIVDFKNRYTEKDEEMMRQWGGKSALPD